MWFVPQGDRFRRGFDREKPLMDECDGYLGALRTTASSQALGFMLTFNMPTALRIDGLWVVIYPNDHRPPHVHVLGAGTEAVFILNCPVGPPTLRGSFGFTTAELNRIASALAENLTALCAEWERVDADK